MDLSVIIVNYNVKYFLEQCLYSVQKAMKNIAGEIWVVDNNSVDGSIAMLKDKFPQVKRIENDQNVGFSKANNQAIRIANGNYILLLNPDTLVEEDTFEKCIRFMNENADCGALGVKMINGMGNYLPESKRGLPTPLTSFYKMAGLSSLFPRSKQFARYYLGHLDSEQTNPVEVLCGAFMLIPKKVLESVGLLDETFFMYGEDIDLSYRISKAGYTVYYFPETRIIHYKGESTKKASLNYVYTFYNAMSIFVRKHYKGKHALFSLFIIKIAIWFAAVLSVIKRTIQTIWVPVVDFLFVWGGALCIKNIWAHLKWDNIYYYPHEYTYFIPIYVLVLLLSVFFAGGYDKPFRYKTMVKGLVVGMLLLLLFYSIAGETYRFSRILIFFDGLWAFIVMSLVRLILFLGGIKGYQLNDSKKHYIIVGNYDECERVNALLNNIGINPGFVGYASIDSQSKEKSSQFIGNRNQLKEILKIYQINEVIFCGKNIQPQEIISIMSELQQTGVEYKIAPEESPFIIGSNTINTIEDLFTVDINSINTNTNRRNKRLLDIILSVFFLFTYPFIVWVVQHKLHFLRNIVKVLFGHISWVGYAKPYEKKLPSIKKGILSPANVFSNRNIKSETLEKLNILYAKNYSPIYDLKVIFRNIPYLGAESQ